jgi:hypothetical protein
MIVRYRPSLHALMRVLAIAVALAFSLSAVSIAYAAGRQAGRSDALGGAQVEQHHKPALVRG